MSDEDVIQNECLNDVEVMRARWRNRRRMAWVSLLAMITVTCLILFTKIVPETRLTILSDVITWFYFSCASIIGMYMGATTWASVKGK